MSRTEDEAVYRKAAADLARMLQPDLSDLPPAQTTVAMLKAFGRNGPRQDWLEEFRRLVHDESAGRVTLVGVDRETVPPPVVKSPAASYQRLVDSQDETEQLLVMGPFEPPFQFTGTTHSGGDADDDSPPLTDPSRAGQPSGRSRYEGVASGEVNASVARGRLASP
ncbi:MULTISPECIES: hypothetical protein [unclassified Streptomyces]|uniref:hypothetical protein n=1 Tax=unclassified Streptomyces TaxID=2593676 RepID=UPI0022549A24|nr:MULTISPECIES: hypothetical protein [unclassified Streptomyces]MCX5012501.1 hypothetical protein [Streptomyces sp. NBC_00555]MCX5606466.1 hypothetical protein [Streptomyces sp. NBC_00047]